MAFAPIQPLMKPRLEQVVLNLLMNAIHAVADRPGCDHEITVKTAVLDDGKRT